MVFSGMGLDNVPNISKADISKYKSLIDTELSNSSLINTVQDVVSKTISQTIIKNKSNITSIIDLHNRINFVAGNRCQSMSGGFVMREIRQDIVIDSTTTTDKQTNITVDVTSEVNNNISENIKNMTSNTDTITNKAYIGTTLEGLVDSAAAAEALSKLSNIPAKVLSNGDCAGIASNCSSKNVDTDLQNKFKLDNNFSLSDAINTSNLSSSTITQDDIKELLQEISGNNELLVKNVCPKAINVNNIEQKINVKSLMTTKTINRLSSKIATNYINKIDKIISNMNKHALTTKNDINKGDIAAFGDVTAALLKAAGKLIGNSIDPDGRAKLPEPLVTTSSIKKSGGNSAMIIVIVIIVIILLGLLGYFVIYPQFFK